MDAPDFSRYNKTQLRQILTRIDRERFPERVREIEARLEAFELASSLAVSEQPTPKSANQQTAMGLDGISHAAMTWLIAGALLITFIGISFSVRHTSVAREKWFDHQAKMDNYGVVADAVIIAKYCGSKSVIYSWKWNEKQLQGSGRSCNSSCSQAKLGDEARIRFLPTSPGDVRCEPDDIGSRIGAPNYLDPILLVILILAALIGPFVWLLGTRETQE
jgi:hypothetical protein